MRLTDALALMLFAAAGSGSPGPNNTLLLASGVRFGFRRTLPHVIGTAAGISVMIVAVAAGIGAALAAVPAAQIALKVAASVYLLALAFRLVRRAGVGDSDLAAPLTLRQAVTFQFLNPKGWLFALAVVGGFTPPGSAPLMGGLAVGAGVGGMVVATASVWALGGSALGRVLGSDRSRRAMTVALALLMIASVAFLWV